MTFDGLPVSSVALISRLEIRQAPSPNSLFSSPCANVNVKHHKTDIKLQIPRLLPGPTRSQLRNMDTVMSLLLLTSLIHSTKYPPKLKTKKHALIQRARTPIRGKKRNVSCFGRTGSHKIGTIDDRTQSFRIHVQLSAPAIRCRFDSRS
jgi:hypothetical protein